MMERDEFRELEPHCEGVRALHVPSTGIVDYTVVAQKYAELIRQAGGEIVFDAKVIGLRADNGGNVVETKAGTFRARYVINCAGLYSDAITRMAGLETNLEIIPFRGEYYEIRPERRSLVKNLIYPVPDPRFPFLGVHFTRRVNGSVEAGPNAVLAFRREGYTGTAPDMTEAIEMLRFAGFWKMAKKYWRKGMAEQYRSWVKPAFTKALQTDGSGAPGFRPGARRLGRARAGGRCQRQPGGRLLLHAQRQHDSRLQCALAGGNRLAGSWEGDCRDDGGEVQPGRSPVNPGAPGLAIFETWGFDTDSLNRSLVEST